MVNTLPRRFTLTTVILWIIIVIKKKKIAAELNSDFFFFFISFVSYYQFVISYHRKISRDGLFWSVMSFIHIGPALKKKLQKNKTIIVNNSIVWNILYTSMTKNKNKKYNILLLLIGGSNCIKSYNINNKTSNLKFCIDLLTHLEHSVW